jgi:glutathione synthase/RimK-type ligase-like ATP-grasp enzyme
VGDELFACQVRSNADDYRYAGRQGHQVGIRSCDLPLEWANRCRALTAAIGLVVAGIDLRRTPEGEWYCFEVNPSPAFTYYQEATGQPIAAAVARLLVEGRRGSRHDGSVVEEGVTVGHASPVCGRQRRRDPRE